MSSSFPSESGPSSATDTTVQRSDNEQDNYDSPAAVYRRMLIVLTNERLASELLPYEHFLIDCLQEQIEYMDQNIKEFGEQLGKFPTEQHRMELERFRYVMTSYLRTRLLKIEKFAPSLARLYRKNKREGRPNEQMSRQELKYLDNYMMDMKEYYQIAYSDPIGQATDHRMPDSVAKYDVMKQSNGDAFSWDVDYQFVKALKDTTIQVDDPVTGIETLRLKENSQYFLPYSALRPSLQSHGKDLVLL